MPQNPPATSPGPHPRLPPTLDEVDRSILQALLEDGRMANVTLAARVGIPETTCIGRVRSLRLRGILTGVHAQLDLEAVGLPVQALVAIRLSGHDRARVMRLGDELAALPGVLAAYNVSGADDFVVHVTAGSPSELREIVLDNIAARAGVVHVETSFVFSAHPGQRILG